MRTRSQIKKEYLGTFKTIEIEKRDVESGIFGPTFTKEGGMIKYYEGWQDALRFVLGICSKCEKPGVKYGCTQCEKCRKDWKKKYG